MIRAAHAGNTRAHNPNLASIINGDILRRAVLVALVMGSILTLANQFTAIFGSEEFEYLPLALVYTTPFVVVTISQILGFRRAMMDARQNGCRRLGEEPVLATALAHGIPLRSVLVGMLVGSVNASIVMAVAHLEGASMNSLPVVLLAQAYALPLAFGLLSQTIAYRRAVQAFRLRSAGHRTGTARASVLPDIDESFRAPIAAYTPNLMETHSNDTDR